MLSRRLSIALTVFALGILPLAAQVSPGSTLTIAVTGTLGPILAGPDPLNANGHTGSVTLIADQSLTPTKVTGSSALYILPPGAITDVIGRRSFTTTTPAKMNISLTSTADILTVAYHSRENTVTVVKAYLAPGSWNTGILQHPVPFSPSPQQLTSATVAGGPGTKLEYTKNGTLTVLGMPGTASASAPANPVLPNLEPSGQ
jgi:hypothetical protein